MTIISNYYSTDTTWCLGKASEELTEEMMLKKTEKNRKRRQAAQRRKEKRKVYMAICGVGNILFLCRQRQCANCWKNRARKGRKTRYMSLLSSILSSAFLSQ